MNIKKSKYDYAIYMSLMVVGAILLIYENYTSLWRTLFLYIVFIFLTILNNLLLDGNKGYNTVLTIFQCSIIMIITYITSGYGGISLLFIVLISIINRYKKKFSVYYILILNSLFIVILYITPNCNIHTFYPAMFILLSSFIITLVLFYIKDLLKLQCGNEERINELQLNRKKLKDLNKQLEQYSKEMEKITILKERNRMSKKIHDTMGHVLTAIIVQLEAAETLIKTSTHEALLLKISNAKNQGKEGLNTIKDTLAYIDKDNMQFEDRIFEFIKKTKSNMNINILSQISIKGTLSTIIQKLILSSLKEGITNGVRHGEASAFLFRLSIFEGNINFYLEDNGKGSEKINMGYGLTSIEEQTLLCKGHFKVQSIVEGGFVMEMNLPLYKEDKS